MHTQNLYHGNITLQNILVETHTYKVFLLDFGSAYCYVLLDNNFNIQQNNFMSPEQSKKRVNANDIQDITIKTDIFSFGLCMLRMLTDTYDQSIFSDYKSYDDVDKIFEKIYEYELGEIEKELCPLIKTMLENDVAKRPGIEEVCQKLISIYKKVRKSYHYEINVLSKEHQKYCEENEIRPPQFTKHFEEKLKNSYPYIAFGENKEKRNILKVALNDIAFICNADNENEEKYLFCFKISTDSREIDSIREKGVRLYDSFIITTGNPQKHYDDISYLKEELKEKFNNQQKAKEKLEQDKRNIDTEEKFLKAMKKWIESEKHTQKAHLCEKNKGSQTLRFNIILEAKDSFTLKDESDKQKEVLAQRIFEDGLSDNPHENVFKTLQKLYEQDIFSKQSKDICQKIQERNEGNLENLEKRFKKQPKDLRYKFIFYGLYKDFFAKPNEQRQNNKDFKKGDRVVFDKKISSPRLSGTINEVDAKNGTITIKVENEIIRRKNLEIDTEYFISRDVRMEESILKKEQRGLNKLIKGETHCPKLLAKINNPKILSNPDLIDIGYWFNEKLDENQRLAVQKALSLDSNVDADILLIQGPPGTGKTTTITEIVQQYLKENKHNRILVVSQSHQAVDNVLEKICKEVKVVRIGRIEDNGETKISKIAQDYMETKVINTLIQENIKRIKNKPTDKPEFKQIQQEFLESLQTLSEQTSEVQTKNEKTPDSELADIFLKDIRVIFGTLIGIDSYRDRGMVFDLVIVDEAGRAFLSELSVSLNKAKKIILVGDHKQLAPVVKEEIEPFLYQVKITKEQAKESFFGRFYERMQESNKENLYHFLNTNYRSHCDICRLYSETFYEDKLHTPSFLRREHNLDLYSSSVILLSTSQLKNKEAKQDENEFGWYNLCHIDIIKKELEKIQKELKEKRYKKNIGIITPYRLQAKKLKKALSGAINVDIGTVDSFQGSDRDIIIYDSVRSGEDKNIKFISDEKRLNVSLSRAKELLIIVGDTDFLYSATTQDTNNPFKDILETIYNDDRYKQSVIELNTNKED